MSKNKYDLIVVGAGSGGCATAKVAAEQGLKVLLIDKRKKDDIGNKLTFDTIPVYAFEALGIPVPEGEELDMRMLKLKVFSPNRKHSFEANLDGYLLDSRRS
jgi:flavin-dependent dehydrogenase